MVEDLKLYVKMHSESDLDMFARDVSLRLGYLLCGLLLAVNYQGKERSKIEYWMYYGRVADMCTSLWADVGKGRL